MNEIVENSVVLKQILVRSADRDLVGKSPYYDTGVVVVLSDKLLHLRDGVLTSAGHMLGDIGDLCPDYKTLFITQIVEILIVLIVCQTNGSRADLHDQLDILLMMLGEQSVAHAPSVLVARDAAQGVLLSVEDKAVVGVDLKATATEACGYIVENRVILYDLCRAGVKIPGACPPDRITPTTCFLFWLVF